MTVIVEDTRIARVAKLTLRVAWYSARTFRLVRLTDPAMSPTDDGAAEPAGLADDAVVCDADAPAGVPEPAGAVDPAGAVEPAGVPEPAGVADAPGSIADGALEADGPRAAIRSGSAPPGGRDEVRPTAAATTSSPASARPASQRGVGRATVRSAGRVRWVIEAILGGLPQSVDRRYTAAMTTSERPPGAAGVDPAAGERLVAAIHGTLPDVRLLLDPLDREPYRNDETAYLSAGLPVAVALPETTADVAALVRLAAEHLVPVVPRGAGSGLSGGAAGIEGGLTIALTRMDRVLEIDRSNLVVVTQPGVLNANLKAAVAAEGLFYAPDPASYEICSIGGNLGTNAGGLCCVKYGQTRDSVLGLEVVLADGRVIRTGGRNVKDVAGYALTHLFVGSQGTLGIITEATLRLHVAPPPRSTFLAFFATVPAAGDAVAAIIGAGLHPVTLERLDHETILAVDDAFGLGLERDAAAMLLVESDLPSAAAEAELAIAVVACEAAGATSVVRAQDPTEADWLRQARRLALRALERQGVVRMEDVGVPRGRVPELLIAIAAAAERHGVRVATFGHAGDGNLHPNFVFDHGDPRAAELTERVRDEIFAAALALGGTVTAEHGIGLSRRAALVDQVGPDVIDVMRSVKAALDPLGILNPGRVI